MTATTPLPPPSSSSSSFISTSTSTSTSASTATSISTHLHLYLHSQPSTREPVPFTLTPPELFAIITDTPPSSIYRCSRLTLENLPFLKTLRLKTILSLTPETPATNLLQEDGVTLQHIPLWQTATWETFSPLAERALGFLTEDCLPALIVDGGHGTFVGVLRRLMGWNYTSVLLEYRSFAGSHARYVNEEFVEMVDTEQICIPEGIDWLARRGKGKGKEKEEGVAAGSRIENGKVLESIKVL